MIRVHIEAASAVAKAGLEALLREQPEIEVVDCENDADVLLRNVGALLRDPAGENASAPLVVLTDEPVRNILRAGARSVLPSSATPVQIVAAIHAAAAGLAAVPTEELAAVLPSIETVLPAEALTPRELEVLEMLAEGLSNKMIAYRLNISTHTAKFHVNAILAKLGAGTRTEAVMRGIRLGLVQV